MFSNAAQTTTHDCQRAFLGAIADRLSSHTVIAIVWILSLSIALPPLFGWSYYAPEDNGIRWVFVHAKYKSLGNVLWLSELKEHFRYNTAISVVLRYGRTQMESHTSSIYSLLVGLCQMLSSLDQPLKWFDIKNR